MADVTAASAQDAASTGSETPTQKAARLRREKRQRKMTEEGEDRLNRIKALNGGIAPPEEILGGDKVTRSATVYDDPEEIDISKMAPNVSDNRRAQTFPNDPFSTAMLQMQQQQRQQTRPGQKQGQGGEDEDPMMKMMQQMMGMMGGSPDSRNPNAPPQLPQMLQSLMDNAKQQQATQAQKPAPPPASVWLWKIVHAVFAITLASYVALTSVFSGTELARTESVYTASNSNPLGPKLFVLFTSVELVLQSSRYFIEGGQLQGNGMLATVSNFLPPPYSNWIRVAGRYITIAQTIFGDLMMVVFVLGVLAWWRGLDNPAF